MYFNTFAYYVFQAFVEELKEGSSSDPGNIIGKFGVGFYSAFMVAEKVEVLSRTRDHDAVGYRWTSDGWVALTSSSFILNSN